MEIRLARKSDAVLIADMSRRRVEHGLNWSWRGRRVLAMIRHAECSVIVACEQGELMGFAIMEFHAVHSHLSLLAVERDVQGQGIASKLLDWLTDSARVAGIEKIVLEVRCDNDRAISFYENHGYQRQQTIEGYYQGRESAYRMCLQLMSAETAAQRP